MSIHKRPAIPALSLIVLLTGCGKDESHPLTSVELSALAQPAVFKVVELGEYQLHDVRFRANTATLSAIADSPQCWSRMADSPSQYLDILLHSDQLHTVRRVFATGSSVAVASTGVLLTNSHVISPPDPQSLGALLPGAIGAASSLVNGLQARPRSRMEELLGSSGAPGCRLTLNPENRETMEVKLAVWMIKSGVMTAAKLGAVYVVTRPRMMQFPTMRPLLDLISRDLKSQGLTPRLPSLSEMLLHPSTPASLMTADPSEITVNLPGPSDDPSTYATEAEILAHGDIFPGEDVAVLKTKQPLDLICLRLGDSSVAELPNGSEVAAFGFPGAAEMPQLVQDQAHPKVIRHDGTVVQRVQTEKNWEALYLTAAISEGDSGGPVLDRFGRVVALNVFGSTTRSQNNVAVPINLAKKYLDQAKVQAAPGVSTEHWIKGQQWFSRKEYAKALDEFEIVNRVRTAKGGTDSRSFFERITSSGKSSPFEPTFSPGNDYVEQAIQICKDAMHKR